MNKGVITKPHLSPVYAELQCYSQWTTTRGKSYGDSSQPVSKYLSLTWGWAEVLTMAPFFQLYCTEQVVWPELFFSSPSCVSQVMASEWEGAFFLTNGSQPSELRYRQTNETVGCDPRSGWGRNRNTPANNDQRSRFRSKIWRRKKHTWEEEQFLITAFL